MAKKEDLYVGQEVVLRGQNRIDVDKGEITKIGRTLVTIQNIKYKWNAEQYRIEEQTANDGYGHTYFRTLAQEAEASQKVADLETLKEFGLKLEWNAKPQAQILHEVAEFLRSKSL